MTALPIPPAPTIAIFAALSLLLPDATDLRQNDVPRVAFKLVCLEVGEREGRKTYFPPLSKVPKPPAPRDVSLSSTTSLKCALVTGAGTS